MNRRVLIIAVAGLLLAICAALILFLMKKNYLKNINLLKKQYVFQQTEFINPYDIEEVQIENPNDNMMFAKQPNGQWLMTQPIKTGTNPDAMVMVLSRLTTMKVDRIVEENPKDISIYGLDKPDIKVAFRLKNESKWRHLHFGRRSPIKGTYYAIDPDVGNVILVPFEQKFDFNFSQASYRDVKLINLKDTKVEHFKIEYPDKTYEFEYNPTYNMWWEKQPLDRFADFQSILAVLNTFESYEVDSILNSEDPSNETSLANPIYTITFRNQKQELRTIIFANDRAKIVETNVIFRFPTERFITNFADLLQNTERKKAFEIQYAAKNITISVKGKSIPITSGKKSGQYVLGGDENLRLDSAKITMLYNSLLVAKHLGYVGTKIDQNPAEYGLDNPAAKVEMILYNNNETKIELYFGKKTPDGKRIYVASSEDPYVRLTDIGAMKFISGDQKFYMPEIQ